MKKILLSGLLLFNVVFAFSQCPDLLQAMVNSCGTSEGNNEFIVFTTAVTAPASSYTFNYGSTNPPTVNNLAGTDATAKTGTGTMTSTTCSVVEVTSPATSIPAGSRVIFISANLDQNYNLTGLCDGINPLYVVYIKTNTDGGVNSNWNTGGTLTNSSTTPRYLQVTYSGSSTCDNTNAPVKTYTASGNWPVLTGAMGDGNFVTWRGADTAFYNNNGCTNIILPVSLVNLYVSAGNNGNIVTWQTAQELNAASFVIEKSFDGKNFTSVGSVAANNNSSTLRTYHFTDPGVEYKVTYYRLRSVDKDGGFTLSKIVRINPAKNALSIGNIYPNPASESLFIEYNLPQRELMQVMIIDMSGKMVKYQQVYGVALFNKLEINVAALPHGKYTIKMMSAQNMVVDSFVK